MLEITQEDRTLLADTARSWARARVPVTEYRRQRDRGSAGAMDPAVYAQMAGMGWLDMIVPTELGGGDLGFECLGLIVEQLGRSLASSPLMASAVGATSALVLGGSAEQQARWLPRLGDGSATGTLAVEEGARHDPAALAMPARRTGGRFILDGRKVMVEAGMTCDLLVVAARTSGKSGEGHGLTLFCCDADAPGVTREYLDEVDVRGRAIVTFRNVELAAEQVLGEVDRGMAVLEPALDRVRAVTAAEMLGGALQAFETTVDYLKVRTQFGHLIGSFQALQHRAADLLADIELTRFAVHGALRALDRDSAGAPLAVSTAKALAGTTFARVAREMIQLHGGIGMTDEHDAGLYLKRSCALDALGGNAGYHRERAARLMGI
jgi:alkylation response protein AidB-like acyl-CoA dehydrogenase